MPVLYDHAAVSEWALEATAWIKNTQLIIRESSEREMADSTGVIDSLFNEVYDDAGVPTFNENPLYDEEKMSSSVDHANKVTQTYGVEIMSINIISATPCDQALTRALASGAVASAEALQAETAARGKARAVAIEAEAGLVAQLQQEAALVA